MDIKCKKTKCEFNKDYACMAKKLDVSTNNMCHTFCPNEKKQVDDKTKKIFFEKVDYAPCTHCKTKTITCQSNCIFACDDVCTANGITVSCEDEGAKCITHKPNLTTKK